MTRDRTKRKMCWRDCIFSKHQPCLLHVERFCPYYVSPEQATEYLRQFNELLEEMTKNGN
jgi:hypothetical protein